jgi:hypothetical protein
VGGDKLYKLYAVVSDSRVLKNSQFQGMERFYNTLRMKGYILRTSSLWVRGLILALFTQYAYAVTFAKTYGGSSDDYARFVQQTSDGGYIVAGTTYSFGAGEWDIFLIKTDAKGNIQWAKAYGGKGSEQASSVQQTSDGGYIVAGYTTSFGAGKGDVFLIKTDANGNIIWAKTYGGKGDNSVSSVQQTSDGGYIVVGTTGSFRGGDTDIFLIKTDAKGNIQWAKTYKGTDDDYALASSVQQTSDGGYIVVGRTGSFDTGEDEIFLIKVDAKGNIQWAKTYGGKGSGEASSVQQTSDGGYIVAGTTDSFGAGGDDIFLIKTDAKGNVQWAKTYGGAGDDYAYSVQQTSDGGYIVAGYTRSFGAGWDDIILIKTDARGNIGSCSIVQDASPIVNNASFPVTSQSPSVSSPSPTVNSVSPTVTSPNLTVSAPCP